jgi:hypothetical protein
MTIRRDLDGALRSWAVGDWEAYEVVGEIIDAAITALRKRLPELTRGDLDLLLADTRRDAERTVCALISGTVHVDTAVNIVASRFFGED